MLNFVVEFWMEHFSLEGSKGVFCFNPAGNADFLKVEKFRLFLFVCFNPKLISF